MTWLGFIFGALSLIAVLYLSFFSGKEDTGSRRKMLVVLPFENLGPEEEAYFAAGITEEITNRLAMVSGLGVISSKSAFHYAKTNKTIKQIGNELNVEYVLQGTVRWAREPAPERKIRIGLQLVQVSDDTYLWTESFDRALDDIFKIQSSIAGSVVEQLGLKLLEPESKAVQARPTQNLEAFQAYLAASTMPHAPTIPCKIGAWRRKVFSRRWRWTRHLCWRTPSFPKRTLSFIIWATINPRTAMPWPSGPLNARWN
jgi:TolB-like protein